MAWIHMWTVFIVLERWRFFSVFSFFLSLPSLLCIQYNTWKRYYCSEIWLVWGWLFQAVLMIFSRTAESNGAISYHLKIIQNWEVMELIGLWKTFISTVKLTKFASTLAKNNITNSPLQSSRGSGGWAMIPKVQRLPKSHLLQNPVWLWRRAIELCGTSVFLSDVWKQGRRHKCSHKLSKSSLCEDYVLRLSKKIPKESPICAFWILSRTNMY